MRALILLVLSIPITATAQSHFGAALKVGAPIQGWFDNGSLTGRDTFGDKSGHRLIGAAVEVRFATIYSVEFSGMYRRIGRDAGGGQMFYSYSERERGYGWDFPIVARVRLPFRAAGMRPFFEAGPSIHWLHTHTDFETVFAFTGPQSIVRSSSVTSDTVGGETFGGGIETAGAVRFSVDARYTHWQSGSCETTPTRCENPHQVAIVFGLGF
jgi:hypothetical protein